MKREGAPAASWKSAGEVGRVFLWIGTVGFGGPAALIALMHSEIVERRKWLSEQQFADLYGATNLIPGPNAMEMALHVGLTRGGWVGFFASGAGFALPAVTIVSVLAALYVRFGGLPAVSWLLYGIKPVVIALILQALWNLGKTVFKRWLLAAIGLTVLGLYFLKVNEIALLFGGGLLVMLVEQAQRKPPPKVASFVPLLGLGAPALAAVPYSASTLFLSFLKIGGVLYGTGYVLLAFLRPEFVLRLGWLSDQQLLDAVAIGQVTPGPFFSTAAFIGYLKGGLAGAALGALGIFLPSFVYVAATHSWVERARSSPWAASLLDGVNATSLGLMAAVTVELGQGAFVDPPAIAIGVLAFVLLVRRKINPSWLILAGAIIGLVRWLIGL